MLAVGGINLCSNESSTAAASRAPAAPSGCPVTPLIDVIGGLFEPNTASTACASAASLSGVDVPCALTCLIWSAFRPASSRASFMHAIAPTPPGDGAVM